MMAKAKARKPAKKKKAAVKKTKAVPTRANTKQTQLVAMLQRPDGATVAEIAKKLDWQPHSVRGAFVGVIKKRLGLDLQSEKVEGRGRVYRIAA
jgi:predicted ArsR family transcriptional regulator